jgi:hypothetical protein
MVRGLADAAREEEAERRAEYKVAIKEETLSWAQVAGILEEKKRSREEKKRSRGDPARPWGPDYERGGI